MGAGGAALIAVVEGRAPPLVVAAEGMGALGAEELVLAALDGFAQLKEREGENAAMRVQLEESTAAAERMRLEAEVQRIQTAELSQALQRAEERLLEQSSTFQAQLDEAAAMRTRDLDSQATLEASLRQSEVKGFELKAQHFRECEEFKERICRLEYELGQAIAQRDDSVEQLEEERRRLKAEKKCAVNGLKAELAQKMGVCSCSQNSLSDLTVEDFAQQLRTVEARGDALCKDLECLRAEKVNVEQKLIVCEAERERFFAQAEQCRAAGREELALLTQQLQAERERNALLVEQQRQASSMGGESEARLPELTLQLDQLQSALSSVQAQLTEATAQLCSSRSEAEGLRSLLARKELEGDDYSLLISQNDLLKKKVRTLEHRLDDGAARTAQIKQLERVVEQRELELERLREESNGTARQLRAEAEQLRERMDVRKNEEFIGMEKKYITYVQRMTEVLNLVQNMKLAKEHQESIIKLLI